MRDTEIRRSEKERCTEMQFKRQFFICSYPSEKSAIWKDSYSYVARARYFFSILYAAQTQTNAVRSI